MNDLTLSFLELHLANTNPALKPANLRSIWDAARQQLRHLTYSPQRQLSVSKP